MTEPARRDHPPETTGPSGGAPEGRIPSARRLSPGRGLAVAVYPERVARAIPDKVRTPSQALRLVASPERAALAQATSRALIAHPAIPRSWPAPPRRPYHPAATPSPPAPPPIGGTGLHVHVRPPARAPRSGRERPPPARAAPRPPSVLPERPPPLPAPPSLIPGSSALERPPWRPWWRRLLKRLRTRPAAVVAPPAEAPPHPPL
jgi:hypothetical protein